MERSYSQKSAILTGIKMVVAGLIAFYLYRVMPWPEAYWIIVTVAAVTRPGVTDTFSKITTRVFGTLIGGLLAYLILIAFTGNNTLIAISFFLVIICSSYVALQKSVLNYGGIVIGLTLTIVLSTTLAHHMQIYMVDYRVIYILIGIGCIAVVNLFLRLIFPKKEPAVQNLKEKFRIAFFQFVQWRENRPLMKASLSTAIAASIVFVPWLFIRYPGGYWAAISCFFIMEECFVSAQKKGWLRFLSHVIAAAIGGASAILIGHHVNFLMIPLVLSFFVFGYMMVASKTLSNACTTMAIALSVMLFDHPGLHAGLEVVATRFVNVIGGIAVGLIVTYIMHHKNKNLLPS